MDWSPIVSKTRLEGPRTPVAADHFPFDCVMMQGKEYRHPQFPFVYTDTDNHVEEALCEALGPEALARCHVAEPLKQYYNFANASTRRLLVSYFGGEYPGSRWENQMGVIEFFAETAERIQDARGNLTHGVPGPVDALWDGLARSGSLGRSLLVETIRHVRDNVFPEAFLESAGTNTFIAPFHFVSGTADLARRMQSKLRWGGVVLVHDSGATTAHLYVAGYLTVLGGETFWVQTLEPTELDVRGTVPLWQILVRAAVCDVRDRTTVLGQFSAYLAGVVTNHTEPEDRQYTLDLILWRPSRAAAKRPRQEPALHLESHVFRLVADSPGGPEFCPQPGDAIEELVADALTPELVNAYRMVVEHGADGVRSRPSLMETARAIFATSRMPEEYRFAFVYDWPVMRTRPINRERIANLDPELAVSPSARIYAQLMRFLDVGESQVDVFFDSVALMLLGEGRTDEIALPGSDVARKLRRAAEPIGSRGVDMAFGDAELGRALLTRLVATGPDRDGFPFRIRPTDHVLQVVPLPFVFRAYGTAASQPPEESGEPAAPAAWQWGGIAYVGETTGFTGRRLEVAFDGFVILHTGDGHHLFRAVSAGDQTSPYHSTRWLLTRISLRLRSLMRGDARQGLAVGTWGYPRPNTTEPTVALVSLVIDDA